MIYDGGLDKKVYEPEAAFDKLHEDAYNSFIQEGNLNELSGAVSKIAAMEGIDYPKMVDEAGSDGVLRSAAGLPDAVAKGK